jgi:hypothetical protein
MRRAQSGACGHYVVDQYNICAFTRASDNQERILDICPALSPGQPHLIPMSITQRQNAPGGDVETGDPQNASGRLCEVVYHIRITFPDCPPRRSDRNQIQNGNVIEGGLRWARIQMRE